MEKFNCHNGMENIHVCWFFIMKIKKFNLIWCHFVDKLWNFEHLDILTIRRYFVIICWLFTFDFQSFYDQVSSLWNYDKLNNICWYLIVMWSGSSLHLWLFNICWCFMKCWNSNTIMILHYISKSWVILRFFSVFKTETL